MSTSTIIHDPRLIAARIEGYLQKFRKLPMSRLFVEEDDGVLLSLPRYLSSKLNDNTKACEYSWSWRARDSDSDRLGRPYVPSGEQRIEHLISCFDEEDAVSKLLAEFVAPKLEGMAVHSLERISFLMGEVPFRFKGFDDYKDQLFFLEVLYKIEVAYRDILQLRDILETSCNFSLFEGTSTGNIVEDDVLIKAEVFLEFVRGESVEAKRFTVLCDQLVKRLDAVIN